MHHRKTPTFVTLCSSLILAVAAKAGLGQTGSATVVPVRIILATNGQAESNFLFAKIKRPELATDSFTNPLIGSSKPNVQSYDFEFMQKLDGELKKLGLSTLDIGDTRVFFSESLYSEKSFALYQSVMSKLADSVDVDGRLDLSRDPGLVDIAKESAGNERNLDLTGAQPYLRVNVRLTVQEGNKTWSAGEPISANDDVSKRDGKEVSLAPLYEKQDQTSREEALEDHFGFPNPYSLKFTYLGKHLNNLEKWRIVNAISQFILDKATKMKETRDGAVSQLLKKMMNVADMNSEFGKSLSNWSPSLQDLLINAQENPHGMGMGFTVSQDALSKYGNSITLTGAQVDFGLAFLVSRAENSQIFLGIP